MRKMERKHNVASLKRYPGKPAPPPNPKITYCDRRGFRKWRGLGDFEWLGFGVGVFWAWKKDKKSTPNPRQLRNILYSSRQRGDAIQDIVENAQFSGAQFMMRAAKSVLSKVGEALQENARKQGQKTNICQIDHVLPRFGRASQEKPFSNRTKREKCAKSTLSPPGLVGFLKEIPTKQGKRKNVPNRPCFTQVLAIFGLKKPYKTGEKTRKCQIDPILPPHTVGL